VICALEEVSMTSRRKSPPSGVPPDARNHRSIGDGLRCAERKCSLVAHLASGREGVPSAKVWEGLNELLGELAVLLGAVVTSLPAEVLDERLDV
jgi:hypothetical protein